MALQLRVKKLYMAGLLTVCWFSLLAQEEGSFVDPRDNRTYTTVTYTISGLKQVIVDNDEYRTYVEGNPVSYELKLIDFPSSITWMAQNLNFDMEASKCKYGDATNCEPHGRLYTWEASMNACPDGWHLPSDDEWFLLASLYGGVAFAGEHLKSEELNGTNQSKFNIQKPSIFWSSNELDSASALDWKVNYRWSKLQRWKGGKNLYNCIRCVKDY